MSRTSLVAILPQSAAVGAANHLLAALPSVDYHRLVPDLVRRKVKPGDILHRQGQRLDRVLFPETAICSLIQTLDEGRSVEVAMIGDEGMVGIGVVLWDSTAIADGVVRTGGTVCELGFSVFQREMAQRGAFHAVVTRYANAFFSMTAQSGACNGLHSARQRCCRWLLASSDRLQSDEIAFTHDKLAILLGVRRPTVTILLHNLATVGLIWQQRGKVRIVDRATLATESCECYEYEKRLLR
jgi:CRP-like cAMP-binding protein